MEYEMLVEILENNKRKYNVPYSDSIQCLKDTLKDIEKEYEELIENEHFCSECSDYMTEGYCIDNGAEYYCSEKCLHKHYTEEEYEEMYDNGNGDSYYTTWEE